MNLLVQSADADRIILESGKSEVIFQFRVTVCHPFAPQYRSYLDVDSVAITMLLFMIEPCERCSALSTHHEVQTTDFCVSTAFQELLRVTAQEQSDSTNSSKLAQCFFV